MSVLTNLQARETALAAAIAAHGSEMTTSVDGESVQHDQHRRSMIAELKEIRELIRSESGPFDVMTEGVT